MRKKSLEINFANSDKGKIGLAVYFNTLILSEIESDTKLGEYYEHGTIKDTEIAKLNFYKIESIDSVIKRLEEIKKYLISISAC